MQPGVFDQPMGDVGMAPEPQPAQAQPPIMGTTAFDQEPDYWTAQYQGLSKRERNRIDLNRIFTEGRDRDLLVDQLKDVDVLDIIQQAKQRSQARLDTLIEKLEGVQRTPPPSIPQAGLPDTAESIAGLIATLFAPEGAGQIVEGVLGSTDRRAAVDYQNQANNWEWQQDEAGRQESELRRQIADENRAVTGYEGDEIGYIQRMQEQEQKRQDDEVRRRETALTGVLQRLSSDIDSASYERIPAIVGQMNAIYDALGMPEMKIGEADAATMAAEAKQKAAEAVRLKDQTARNNLFRNLAPYVTSESERQKLIDWVSNLRPEELDVKAGLSIAEQLAEARTKTENATREGKVEALLAKTQLTKDQAEFVRTKTKYYPEYLQVALAGRQIAMFNAAGRAGDIQFDNEFKAWDARTSSEIAGHVARVKKIEERMAEIKKELPGADEDKTEELTLELNNLVRDRKGIRDRIEKLNSTMPGFKPIDMSAVASGLGLPAGTAAPGALPNVGGAEVKVPPKTTAPKTTPPKRTPKKAPAKSKSGTAYKGLEG